MIKWHKTLATYGSVMIASTAVLGLGACTQKSVSFSGDVQPILKARCLECHVPGGDGYIKSGFDMTSYDTLMKGGKFGPLVKPGDPLTSALNMLVEGRAASKMRMPHGREKLSDHEIETLSAWVKQGAKNN